MPNQQRRASHHGGLVEEWVTLRSTAEKWRTWSSRALPADQRTQELHVASVLPSLPLFMLASKPRERAAGLGLALQSGERTGGSEQPASAQRTQHF